MVTVFLMLFGTVPLSEISRQEMMLFIAVFLKFADFYMIGKFYAETKY